MTTLLNTADDLAWLSEVHGVTTDGAACAILHGTEDCPHRVHVYAVDHCDCPPVVWVATDDAGVLRLA